MKLVGCLTLLAVALWSGLTWLAWTIAGAGEASVVTISRWLGLNPSSTQWIAEAFALAGGIAQGLIALVWVAGLGVIALLAWAGSQLPALANDHQPHNGRQPGRVIDGHVTDRTVE